MILLATMASTTSTQPTTKNLSYTVDDLLKRITSLIDTCDYELASTFCARALNIEPKNVVLLETAGTVKLELEKFEEAQEVIYRTT